MVLENTPKGSTPIILVIILGIIFVVGVLIYIFLYFLKPKFNRNNIENKALKKMLKDKDNLEKFNEIKSSLINENGEYTTTILNYLSQKFLRNLTIYAYLDILDNDEIIIANVKNETNFKILLFAHEQELIVEKIFQDEDLKYILPSSNHICYISGKSLNDIEKEIYELKITQIAKTNANKYKIEN